MGCPRCTAYRAQSSSFWDRRSYGMRSYSTVRSDIDASTASTSGITVPPVRVLVVDDHDVVREGLTVILERRCGVEVVGSACNGEQALFSAQTLRPDMIIMDLMLPVINGIDTTRRVIQELPQTRVIVVSACHAPEQVCNALRAGARGYVLKASASAELRDAVVAVTEDRLYVSRAITALFSDGVLVTSLPEGPLDRLSTREREVLRYIVAGSSSSAIAPLLSLSRKTVDTYRARMMSKLGVANRSELIRLAMECTLPTV
jgi:DNA-binding NarL/FixJ family response regulator